MERGVRVIIATGKRPGPWLPPLRTALGFPDDGGRTLNAPSVLLNGLLVTAADGSVVHKQLLPREMVGRLLGFGEQHGLSTHVYAEDRYCCQAHDEWSERVYVYEEGTLEAIGPSAFRALGAADGEEGTFKVVFWGAPEAILAARPHLDALAGDDGEVVSSLETALEVLPSGASKAAGMRAALELLGEGPGDVLALGDGENDLQSAPPPFFRRCAAGAGFSCTHRRLHCRCCACCCFCCESLLLTRAAGCWQCWRTCGRRGATRWRWPTPCRASRPRPAWSAPRTATTAWARRCGISSLARTARPSSRRRSSDYSFADNVSPSSSGAAGVGAIIARASGPNRANTSCRRTLQTTTTRSADAG